MFSVMNKMNLTQLGKKSLFALESLYAAKMISTSEGAQNSEHMTKREKLGPADLSRQQRLKKTIRTLSTINHTKPLAVRATISKDESRDFMAVFPDLVRDLTERVNKYDGKSAAKWLAKALQYNVPRGKKSRGLVTVLTYKQLADKSQLTPENIKLAQYLGWCIELMHSYFLIVDDIMDDSVTRRGQPCWHKLDEVGLNGINDGIMIENGLYYILKKYFSQKDCYVKLLELFHEMALITSIGQQLDVSTSNKNVDSFSMDTYKAIVVNKTSYYTFYLPVALAMHLAGFTDPEAFRQAKTILLEIGHFFQVQDDFMDCFGNPEITGKVGTDIQENKCSWLAVVCMQRASEAQKQIMRECYGKHDPEKITQVKNLYTELGLPNTYAAYEEETYNIIKTHIQQTSRGVPHEVFFKILDTIYQRVS